MRSVVILTVLILRASLLFAQTDSVNFKHVEWQSKRIAPGIRLRRAWFRTKDLFASNQFISVVEVKSNDRNQFDLAFEPKIKRNTSDFAQTTHAIAAINGTFFDVKNGGSVDYIRSNGEVINENKLLKNNERARHQRAALVIKKGKLNIQQWDSSADWEKKLDGEDVMLTGPLLVHDDRYVQLDTDAFNTLRHPRSAIGITDKGRVLLISVDGRSANSAGMSLYELSKIMAWLHCREAINLDGGGSTTLWENKDGVVNYPSDNGKWDHDGQRKVANVIMVTRK